ncbi:hypothetical protein ACTOB_001915 [Actinoplanes oblitus]|uniref:Uncharacterized protein n=1 Tax=Actinoplanes oblitus TaxID=3040509 RepID=A0ABY8WLF7_9ACTN|nr:hypothetical protein [Actinoplanes oblitus]WIM98317.1 hypothetical protein ACTOB_001915 [Actinoplanes oblitus]
MLPIVVAVGIVDAVIQLVSGLVWAALLGTWTRAAAVVNAVLITAYTVPLVWLLAGDHFVNPEFHGFLDAAGGDLRGWLSTTLIAVLVLGGLWDIVDTARRAEQARRGIPAAVPGSGGGYDFG